MIKRSEMEVRLYELFKLVVTLLLVAVLLLLVLLRRDNLSHFFPISEVTPVLSDVTPVLSDITPVLSDVTPVLSQVSPLATTEIIKPTLNPLPLLFAGREAMLTGTGEPNSRLQILIDGAVVSDTLVAENAQWSLPITFNEPKSYQMSVQRVDSSRVPSQSGSPSEPIDFSVAAPPTLNLPTGVFAPGQVVLSGTGQPEQALQLLIDDQLQASVQVPPDGRWSYSLTLSDTKPYQARLHVVDPEGSVLFVSDSILFSVVARTVQPDTPSLNSPEATFVGREVLFTGTGVPDSQLRILINGQVVSQIRVENDAQWLYRTTIHQPGQHQITVQSLDQGGLVVASSEPAILEVAIVPTLNLPAEALVNRDVTLNGKAQAGSVLQILIDGQMISQNQVAADGQWSINTQIDEPGEYQLHVQAVDQSGTVLIASESKILSVTAVVPALNVPIGLLAGSDAILNGTGQPDSDLQLVINGQVVGQTNVGSDGQWSYNTQLKQAGEYQVSAQTLNRNGSVVATSAIGALSIAPQPTHTPTHTPTAPPTQTPTEVPTEVPTEAPTEVPIEAPAEAPTAVPAEAPAEAPTAAPPEAPAEAPTAAPAEAPAEAPTEAPAPAEVPAEAPTEAPPEAPTAVSTPLPAEAPAEAPTEAPPEAPAPAEAPTAAPPEAPTEAPPPAEAPTAAPPEAPTAAPPEAPAEAPTAAPPEAPTAAPPEAPTAAPPEAP